MDFFDICCNVSLFISVSVKFDHLYCYVSLAKSFVSKEPGLKFVGLAYCFLYFHFIDFCSDFSYLSSNEFVGDLSLFFQIFKLLP